MEQSTAVIPLLWSPSSCSVLLEFGPCSFCSALLCSVVFIFSGHFETSTLVGIQKPLLCSAVVPCSVLSGKLTTIHRSHLSLKPLASHSILRGTQKAEQ
ncbi:hypothetical protein AHAS_Ahas18G0193500 [Arachis hypogaea]